MRLKVILRYVGMTLTLNGAFMLLASLIALFNQVDSSFLPLIISGLLCAATGLCSFLFIPPEPNISSKEGYHIVVYTWLACCIFGALPYILWGGEFTVVDAFFESVSGYTTTGASILTDIEALPKGLLFFRSCTAWMGGLGVVLFMMLFLPSMKNFKLRLAKVEISTLSKDNFKYRIQQTARIICIVYLGMTAVQTLLLWAAGMTFFDAVNHSLCCISTCGFGTKNKSILAFNSIPIEVIMTIFMYLGSLHFGLIYTLFKGEKKLWQSPVVRFYTFSLLLGVLFIALDLAVNRAEMYSWLSALRYSSFQVVSIASTSGFVTTDTNFWPMFSILILFFFIFQCGCSGSTSGGIKADRVLILLKSIKAQIKKMQHPNAILPIRFGHTHLEPELVSAVAIFIIFYILIVFVCTLLLTLMGIDLMSGFSAAAACMGNVGPGFGLVGVTDNYSDFPVMAKILLPLVMILGRLEIYGVILIFFIRGWR
jgi:trk system potassium uptake protein TrkH